MIAGNGIIAFVILMAIALTITLRVHDVASLFAAATSSFSETPVVAYFVSDSTDTLHVGDSVKVDININAHIPINVIGMTIKFPEDSFDVISISKEKSFLDLWTEDTVIREDAGEIHFSGGTLRKGGLTGVATALTITLRAKQSGKAELHILALEAFAHDGNGSLVESDKRSIAFTIVGPLPAVDAVAASTQTVLEKLTGDFNDSGSVTIIDMSILTIHIFGQYDARYDLNHDGTLNIADLSVLFSQMQKPM